jgi:hypothetical protein
MSCSSKTVKEKPLHKNKLPIANRNKFTQKIGTDQCWLAVNRTIVELFNTAVTASNNEIVQRTIVSIGEVQAIVPKEKS